MEFNFFQIFLHSYHKIQIHSTKLYTIPLQEHINSMLALHSCDDSQLRVKNVGKNQEIAKSVKMRKFQNFV